MTELSFLSNVFDTFRRRGCLSLAASLAFFSLLSLFPMVFLLLYGISFIVATGVGKVVTFDHIIPWFVDKKK